MAGRNLGHVSKAACKLEEATRELAKFKSDSKFFIAWREGIITPPGLGCGLRGGQVLERLPVPVVSGVMETHVWGNGRFPVPRFIN